MEGTPGVFYHRAFQSAERHVPTSLPRVDGTSRINPWEVPGIGSQSGYPLKWRIFWSALISFLQLEQYLTRPTAFCR